MLTSVADKARLVEKLWTSRRLEAASLQDSLPHNVRVAETEGRPPFPPPPNHPPVNPYLQTNTLTQSEKYSCKNSYTKFKVNYSSSRFTSISNHRPSPLLPRPLARYLLSVNLDSLHWMAHLDSSHHPGLFYEYGDNLDISWPVDHHLHRFSSMWCFIFFGTLIVLGIFSYLQGHRYGRFFCFSLWGKPWESTYYAQTFYEQKCHPTISGQKTWSLESKGNESGPSH